MIGSTLRRSAVLLAGVSAAPLALAQEGTVATPPHWSFIAAIAGLGMAFVLGIIAITFFTESRRTRDKLALVERLVSDGKPVPRELMVREPLQLTLPEQRRRDIRRATAFLCWGIGVGVVFYIVSGGNFRAAAWGLLFIVPGFGNFLKAWLTARDIARGSADSQR